MSSEEKENAGRCQRRHMHMSIQSDAVLHLFMKMHDMLDLILNQPVVPFMAYELVCQYFHL